jgi:hypothetical protein
LAGAGELEALPLQIGHGAGGRAALTDDAGGEEQLPHIVSSQRGAVAEVGQVDSEDGSEQRLVSATKYSAQVVF